MSILSKAEPQLVAALRSAVSDVRVRAIDRLATAHDASHYLLTPQAVATPSTTWEVAQLFAAARETSVPLTFRSGGTSLSGQAVTDGVLVDTRRHFREIEVLDDGRRVRCGPGAVLRAVNARLGWSGRQLGPDPASEIACTIGGVVANNSSGMACGIEANSYRTLDSAVLVLPSGTVVDTGVGDADTALRRNEPQLHAGLTELRDHLRNDPAAVARLEELYSIKNTMGYGLNSFLDFDEPVRILEHLCVGSEGTLAFLAEVTFRTVPVKAHAATGLLIFDDLASATAVLPDLVALGPATVELMDATSLRVAQRDPASPEEIHALEVIEHCALLVEFQEHEENELTGRLTAAAPLWADLSLAVPAEFTTDPRRRAAFWHTRKGLFATVAGNRPSGTTALLEDIAVPVDRLGETCEALNALFEKHGYADAVIFGHAKDGNIHFMITEEFSTDGLRANHHDTYPAANDDRQELARYRAFTEEMVNLVLTRGGTLKAEHGTGRIMAPFVRRQVGDELYEVMRRVKELLDPENLLNPGVLLTDDPNAHLRDLKTTPEVEQEVDRCVECGYCEPVCPSKDLTTTPRERIVIRREIARAQAAGDHQLAETLRAESQYESIDTCAVDGMCQTACPVFINTGDLVRRLREENSSRMEKHGWQFAAKHWDKASRAGSLSLTVADVLPPSLPIGVSELARRVLGEETVPRYTEDLPKGGRPRALIDNPEADIVWFSSCTNTMFGAAEAGEAPPRGVHDPETSDREETAGVAESFRRLCTQAGIRLRTPQGLPGLCCGTPWKSKGFSAGYQDMQHRVVKTLTEATENGKIPVVSDASSCTEGLETMLSEAGVEVIDVVAFTADTILPTLPKVRRIPSLTLHPTCSSTRSGLNHALEQIARFLAESVHIPNSWGCCAFAGDRGMLRPELTASATAAQADEVQEIGAVAHASTNRTCEIAMKRATGKPYRHIIELLAESRPR